jgi:hypothetical protein
MSARHPCALVLSIMLGAWGAAPAVASDGDPDLANAHPAVGFYHVAYTRADASLETLGGCSGTLIAEDVFLTAGHCTFYDSRLLHEDPSYLAAAAWVTLDPVALDNDFHCFLQDIAWPGADDLDCDEAARYHPDFHRASVGAITHPKYPRLTALGDGTIAVGEPLGPGNTDVGVVLLAEPFTATVPLPTAPLGYLDRLDRSGVTLLAVGYGLAYHKTSPASPDQPGGDGPTNFVGPYGVRRVAEIGSIRSITPTRITPTQMNALGEDSVCYWDSGSPLFLVRNGVLERRVVGVLTGGGLWCMGASDPYQRIDIGPARDFLACVDAATTPGEACRCGAEGPLGQCPNE